MNAKIIKCSWGFMPYPFRENGNVYTTYLKSDKPPFLEWINVNEIKTISEIIDYKTKKVIGSSIFYMGGVSLIKDGRTPDELMELINNL